MIGAVIAMESEAEILLDEMQIENVLSACGKTIYTGKAFGKDVMLSVSGVGKVNAAASTAALILRGANVILNFGAAGGLDPTMTEVAEVYLIEKAVQYDFDLTQLNGGEVGTLDGETENFLPLFTPASDLQKRTLGTGDRFNDSPADHALLIRLGAHLRDMEGAAIAQVCKYAGIPLVSVKAVSDVYGAESTTEQFQKNLKRAMLSLKAELPALIGAIDE